MAASNLLYSCLVFRANRVIYEIFSCKKSLFVLFANEKMLADQDVWCREENFTVFMYVLRSIMTP